ncbi:serine hydrolase domain-containing protein [Monashia sp. NPDC004114]
MAGIAIEDAKAVDDRVDETLARWAAVGLAVGVVRDGQLVHFRGHGVADLKTRVPITPDTVFRVASITKTFTAVAIAQLWERGLVDLDAPAQRYLRSYRLVPVRPGITPPTVRHLLTHTSGIPELASATGLFRPLFGEVVKADRPVPSLASRYGRGLRVVAEPGTRWRYTDHGYATLGQIVADVSGRPLADHLAANVFAPLGMTDTSLTRTRAVDERLATGYTLGRRGPRPVRDYEFTTPGASAAFSTPRDMAAYLAALMGGGANERGRIVAPETMQAMFEPQYQPDPRVPGMGLAFFRSAAGGHALVEHGGIAPGFNSQFFVAPNDHLAVMAFTNGARNAMLWLPGELGGLLDLLLRTTAARAEDAGPSNGVAQQPHLWNDLCGWYPLPGPPSDARARMMFGAGATVFVRRGQLHLRCVSPVPMLYRGFRLIPDDPKDPYAFRLDLSALGIGDAGRVFFAPGDGRTNMYFDLNPITVTRLR